MYIYLIDVKLLVLVKVRSLESVPCLSWFCNVLYIILYGVFGSSLLIESTNSMIILLLFGYHAETIILHASFGT